MSPDIIISVDVAKSKPIELRCISPTSGIDGKENGPYHTTAQEADSDDELQEA